MRKPQSPPPLGSPNPGRYVIPRLSTPKILAPPAAQARSMAPRCSNGRSSSPQDLSNMMASTCRFVYARPRGSIWKPGVHGLPNVPIR